MNEMAEQEENHADEKKDEFNDESEEEEEDEDDDEEEDEALQKKTGPPELSNSSISVIKIDKFALEKRRVSRLFPQLLQRAFKDPEVEQLYSAYRERERGPSIPVFIWATLAQSLCLVAPLLWNVASMSTRRTTRNVTVPYSVEENNSISPCYYWSLICICAVINIILTLALVFGVQESDSDNCCAVTRRTIYGKVIPYVGAVLAAIQVLAPVIFQKDTSLDGPGPYYHHPTESSSWLDIILPSDLLPSPAAPPLQGLGWLLLLDFLLYVTLPLTLRSCAVASGILCVSFLGTVGWKLAQQNAPHLAEQLSADALLLFASNCLGLMAFHLADKKQRKAFLETRQSLEMKLVIEEGAREQERLLLSVLPEHVAVRMRQDWGSEGGGQFKKIYMSRHENVSILYADIVGFTAISSTYSAIDLVRILNELFARFDKLADKYHQLRIKILGDCYYCISGAPQERPDHAILCVHMGLSMVDAIKSVRESTQSPVDMRVGIHTGAVLAGVLGQRQWQFDVYSKDCELANKMESSGSPGRVHISERTLAFLGSHFEVEPAHGEKKEEILRNAGLRTFFIVKALKPFRDVSKKNGVAASDGSTVDCEESDVVDEDEEESHSFADEDAAKNAGQTRHSQDYKRRLQQELVNRNGNRELRRHANWLTLRFRESSREREFSRSRETFASVAVLGCPLVLMITGLAQAIVLPRDLPTFVSFSVGFTLIAALALLLVAESFPLKLWWRLVKASEAVNSSVGLRRMVALLVLLVLGACDVSGAASCASPFLPILSPADADGNSDDYKEPVMPHDDNVHLDALQQKLRSCPIPEILSSAGEACLFPAYLAACALLSLEAGALLPHLNQLAKGTALVAIAVAHVAANIGIVADALDCEHRRRLHQHGRSLMFPDRVSLSVLLIAATLVLALLNRSTERASRILFLWRAEVEDQREKAADLRRRNEALVYNILPQHVADHFLGRKQRKHHDLYAHSITEVGVLFASMPNFADFYSEESVNNQGLECLRFLNEVISDFDAILERPEYSAIIKIKTIGSTYMGASGLNPDTLSKADEKDISKRWAHLSLLVQFAFELKRAIANINEQSFNHFVLKMGINHGPITAGVIGARKPHYDIWGNTVNVASRMESTGKAGCIQVTEETRDILLHFGYEFEQRGLVAVKGKGQLLTYYLVGKTNTTENSVA